MSVCLSLFLATVVPATSKGDFTPPAVAYADLVQGRAAAALEAALSSTGLVAVSGIPGFAALRKEVLASTPPCASVSQAAVKHTYPDGTTRHTLAGHTLPGQSGAPPVAHGSKLDACANFDRASVPFRAVVGAATSLFAKQLSALLRLKAPLLFTEDGEEISSFHSVTERGEHLEHWHTYTRPATPPANGTAATIELHTDQGMFIAFAPALMVAGPGNSEATTDSGRFIVGLPDGSHSVARLDPDALVFMLGDGIHQVLPADRLEKYSPRLRAAPHALTVPPTKRGESRAWYGRMVLPPHDAVIPSSLPQHGKTFGHVRALMLEATLHGSDPDVMALGCSGEGARATHRELTACKAGTIYCWHRCMDVTEHDGVWYGLSEEICEAQGLQLQCVDVFSRIYNESYSKHGDYFPGCTEMNASYVDSPVPNLPNYPRDEGSCDQAAWEAYSDTTGYEHWTALGTNGKLMWSVVDGKVKSKMVYNGLFGWLSWGLRNNSEGAYRNGMNGAWVAMALPGGDFTSKDGLNLDIEGSVKAYRIHEKHSAFRFWEGSGQIESAPNQGRNGEAIPTVPDTLETTSLEKDNCFSSMSFTASAIGEESLNIDGTDILIWGANVNNKYIGYHGYTHRGILKMEWKVGASPFVDDGTDVDANGGFLASAGSGIAIAVFGVLLALNRVA